MSSPSWWGLESRRSHAVIVLFLVGAAAVAALLYDRSQTAIHETSADASMTPPDVRTDESPTPAAGGSPDDSSGAKPPADRPDGSQQSEEPEAANVVAGPSSANDPSETPMELAALFAEVSPSVVKIHILDQSGVRIGHGSGFFLDKSEIPAAASSSELDSTRNNTHAFLLVTNHHVLYPAHGIEIECSKGKLPLFAAKVLAESETLDLALISATYRPYDLIAEPTPHPSAISLEDMPPGLGFGELPSIGESVFAVGSPAGLTNSLSEGIISGYRHIKNRTVLQTTVAISEGSSGGALFNGRGMVVGVTTSTLTGAQSVNFAVPASAIQHLLSSAYSGPNPRDVSDGASVSDADFTLRNEYFFPLYEEEELRKYCETASEADCERRRASAWHESLSDEDRQILVRLREAHATRYQLINRVGGFRPGEMQPAVDALESALEQDCGKYTYLVHYLLADSIKFLIPNELAGNEADNASQRQRRIRHLETSRDLNPDFDSARRDLGFLYLEMDRPAEALREADRLVELLPRGWISYVLRMRAWADLGEQESFEKDLNMALELHPAHWTIHSTAGDKYAQFHLLQKAVYHHRIALSISPNDLAKQMTLNSLGCTLAKQGDYIAALQYLEKARELAKETHLDNEEFYGYWIPYCRARLP